ncbi:uncharacterized protein LOC126833423 isoform X2 [Adelges cooleyi]|uniref:uncharacterized protein LOC126833423 isoform X2 n=1 Tax=Adelges cooleyi TaxID=133065 RepID=UPI0021800A66|nr:uncharacterized protein LOC126833423 isoform X2 [Adelges cooleyi]
MSLKSNSLRNRVMSADTDDSIDLLSSLENNSNNNFCSFKRIHGEWYFPLIELSENSQLHLIENRILAHELSISEICTVFKHKLLSQFPTEIFLQRPLIIQKFIQWLCENKEAEQIIECLTILIEKLKYRHAEYVNGLSEYFKLADSDSQSTTPSYITETNSIDQSSQWSIVQFCVSVMPSLMKQITYNHNGAFSLFMSTLRILSSIKDNYSIKCYMDLVFTNSTFQTLTFNESLCSLKFLLIAKALLESNLLEGKFKDKVDGLLRQPYWIHLYPELYYRLAENITEKELLELKVTKMIENICVLLKNKNSNPKQRIELFVKSLPVIWFQKQFILINNFVKDICNDGLLSDPTEYSQVIVYLLSYGVAEVSHYTYNIINTSLKEICNFQYKKTKMFIKYILCTDVIIEIICKGCTNSDKQISHLALEILETILKSKNVLENCEWELILKNLSPAFLFLCCQATPKTTLGHVILNFFDPDQSDQNKITKLQLFHATFLMLMSKDVECQNEANHRMTWLLKSTINKNIILPNDISTIVVDESLDKPKQIANEFSSKDLDEVMELITNKSSNHHTIKCALYKISVMLENTDLCQKFLQKGGMYIVINLLKSSMIITTSHSLLILLLKIIMDFLKKKDDIHNKSKLFTSNLEFQLYLITVLYDFIQVPLVKQYILVILFYCAFDHYLNHFDAIPTIVMCKLNTPFEVAKFEDLNYKTDLFMSPLKIIENKNCCAALILTWSLNHYNSIDLLMESKMSISEQSEVESYVFDNFRKLNIKWSIQKILNDLIAAKTHAIALNSICNLNRYLELSNYVDDFDIDEQLLSNAMNKFLILPPIYSEDLKTLIAVMKLLNSSLKKSILINKFKWVVDTLIKSELMHSKIMDNFNYDETSIHLRNSFFIELHNVYWLCLKKYTNFSRPGLVKLLFDQLPLLNDEFVLSEGVLKCLVVLTENSTCLNEDIVNACLSHLISSFDGINKFYQSNFENIKRYYLIILNHFLHYTIALPNASDVWFGYNWETWIWSMIHCTDPLVRALLFEFSAGLTIIDVPVSCNLISLGLNSFCDANSIENVVVAEQAILFCSNIFCNFKFKNLCKQYIAKLDLDIFVQTIHMCTDNYFKPKGKVFLPSSPKLVANICCMLFNMITLTELDLNIFNENELLVSALVKCLKMFIKPICIEDTNIMEMCGRICSLLTLFIPISDYNFENFISSMSLIYENPNLVLDHCTIMVWRSSFQLITVIAQDFNSKELIITNSLTSALIKSINSNNNDLCVDALKVVTEVCSWLPKKSAHAISIILFSKLAAEWEHKLIRKSLLMALSRLFVKHTFIYKLAQQNCFLKFLISKLKNIQLKCINQTSQKQNLLKNDYLDIVDLCCNVFSVCNQARLDASQELPDIIHKFWPNIIVNFKSEILLHTLQMLVSLTSNCSID